MKAGLIVGLIYGLILTIGFTFYVYSPNVDVYEKIGVGIIVACVSFSFGFNSNIRWF